MMSKHDPTAVTINELQAGWYRTHRSQTERWWTPQNIFYSQRQTHSSVSPIAQAIGEPNGTIAVS